MDERTLDPRTAAEWEAFRGLAHTMVDGMVDHLAHLREKAAWTAMPESVRTSFTEPLPHAGVGMEEAYRAFVERVLPYPNGNLHPRFFGWVQGAGTPLAMMAAMLAAGLNAHLAGFDQAPALVEMQVIRWLAEIVGMPPDASGLFVTGGTMASTIGLAVARHTKAGIDVRAHGNRPGLVFYGSDEPHGWAKKAAELMGLGRDAFHAIAVDRDFRIDLDALRAAIARDRAAGKVPFAILGTAGTVNTGAIDDLEALADIAKANDSWFHVDGAIGGLLGLSSKLAPRVRGIARADSIALDLHKWLSMPFSAACVLVRDRAAHEATFAAKASYLEETARGVIAGGLPFADRGLDLSRGFDALKVWMSLRAHGLGAFAELFEQSVAQAEHLAALVAASPELELVAPVALNIVCFRARGSDTLNEEILVRLQEEGIAVPSGTRLHGRFALRVALVNHRTRFADLDALVDAVRRFAAP